MHTCASVNRVALLSWTCAGYALLYGGGLLTCSCNSQTLALNLYSLHRGLSLDTNAYVACVCCCLADIGGADALGLEDFPFISTGVANYSPELTKLLSQQANWQMLQLRTQLRRFLRGTNITVKQAA